MKTNMKETLLVATERSVENLMKNQKTVATNSARAQTLGRVVPSTTWPPRFPNSPWKSARARQRKPTVARDAATSAAHQKLELSTTRPPTSQTYGRRLSQTGLRGRAETSASSNLRVSAAFGDAMSKSRTNWLLTLERTRGGPTPHFRMLHGGGLESRIDGQNDWWERPPYSG